MHRIVVLALILGLAAPARAQDSICPHPTQDYGSQLACNACNDGWSGILNLVVLDGLVFAKTMSDDQSHKILPILAAGHLAYLGLEAGLRAAAGEKRPLEHWVIIMVARGLATSLAYVAGRQLTTVPAVLATVGLTAAASIPLLVLSPETF